MKKQKHSNSEPADERTQLFRSLKAYGIKRIEVRYDGSGDSGDIHGVDVEPENREEMLEEPLGETGKTIKQYIENLCWEGLESEESGWEINEGSYGSVVFDVADQVIELDHNERVVETVNRTHSL